MTTMTESEIMESTVPIVDKWFYEDSKILEACLEKENELDELYGDGNYMCPYYVALLELAVINVSKGWSKEQVLEEVGAYIDRMQE